MREVLSRYDGVLVQCICFYILQDPCLHENIRSKEVRFLSYTKAAISTSMSYNFERQEGVERAIMDFLALGNLTG
ncbi:hypothetical protein Scep_003528 [Stephania cephalantha]|uniref:Uncharacterized protein n=1 Tax=Stephania cephalantha TaxID=152367 RepID=A0AAP0PWE7_9MAGN